MYLYLPNAQNRFENEENKPSILVSLVENFIWLFGDRKYWGSERSKVCQIVQRGLNHYHKEKLGGGVKYIAEEIKTKAEIDVICSKVPDSEKLLELKFIQF